MIRAGGNGRDRADGAEPVAPRRRHPGALGSGAGACWSSTRGWRGRSASPSPPWRPSACCSSPALGSGHRRASAATASARWGPALAIPVAAQAMCAPVVVLLQGSVSAVGVLANLLAAPLVAPATVAGRRRRAGGLVCGPRRGTLAVLAGGAADARDRPGRARVRRRSPGARCPGPTGRPGRVLLAALTRWRCCSAGRGWSVTPRPTRCWRRRRARRSRRPAPTRHASPGRRRLAVGGLRRRPGRRAGPAHRRRAARSLVDAGPDPALGRRLPEPARGRERSTPSCSPTSTPTTSTGCPGRFAGRVGPRRSSSSPVREPAAPVRTRSTALGAAPHGIPVAAALRRRPPRSGTGGRGRVWWPARRIPDGLGAQQRQRRARRPRRARRRAAARRRRARGGPRPAAARSGRDPAMACAAPRVRRASRRRTTASPTSTTTSWRRSRAPVGGHQRGRGQRLRPPGAATPGGAAAQRVRRLPHRPARRRRHRRAAGPGSVGGGDRRWRPCAGRRAVASDRSGRLRRRTVGPVDCGLGALSTSASRVALHRRHPLQVGGGHRVDRAGARPA